MINEISIVLLLNPSGGEHIDLNIVHNSHTPGSESQDIHLKLDPKTLLIAED